LIDPSATSATSSSTALTHLATNIAAGRRKRAQVKKKKIETVILLFYDFTENSR
jgi:hypothetical protein